VATNCWLVYELVIYIISGWTLNRHSASICNYRVSVTAVVTELLYAEVQYISCDYLPS